MSLFCSSKRLSRSAITSPSLPSEYQAMRSLVVSAAAGPPDAVAARRDSTTDVMMGVTARMDGFFLRAQIKRTGPFLRRHPQRRRFLPHRYPRPGARMPFAACLGSGFPQPLTTTKMTLANVCQSVNPCINRIIAPGGARPRAMRTTIENAIGPDPRETDAEDVRRRLTCHRRGPGRGFGFDRIADRQWRDAPRLEGHGGASARCDRGGRLPAESGGTGAPAWPKPAGGDDRGQSRQSGDGDDRKFD